MTNLLAHDGAVGVLYAQWERIPETALPMAGGVIGGIPSIIGGVVTAAALALASWPAAGADGTRSERGRMTAP